MYPRSINGHCAGTICTSSRISYPTTTQHAHSYDAIPLHARPQFDCLMLGGGGFLTCRDDGAESSGLVLIIDEIVFTTSFDVLAVQQVVRSTVEGEQVGSTVCMWCGRSCGGAGFVRALERAKIGKSARRVKGKGA